jgi:hypothetical protein
MVSNTRRTSTDFLHSLAPIQSLTEGQNHDDANVQRADTVCPLPIRDWDSLGNLHCFESPS